MPKVKVTSRFQILELIDRFVDGTLANAIGSTIVTEAKRQIADGQSPVRGHGRFAKYKDQKSYPGKLKPYRPVNLNLSGETLREFSYRVRQDMVEVGMVDASKESKEIVQAHNEGTANMAMRRIIPQEGEEWSVSIMRKIRDLYGERLRKLIAQANQKSKD
jgi:hypothetical protein